MLADAVLHVLQDLAVAVATATRAGMRKQLALSTAQLLFAVPCTCKLHAVCVCAELGASGCWLSQQGGYSRPRFPCPRSQPDQSRNLFCSAFNKSCLLWKKVVERYGGVAGVSAAPRCPHRPLECITEALCIQSSTTILESVCSCKHDLQVPCASGSAPSTRMRSL